MATVRALTSSDQHMADGHEEERKRVSKACQRCRVRKDRCDGLNPCGNCQSSQTECIYEATTKKRGLPEGYVRGLEKLTYLAFRTIDGLEPVLQAILRDEELKKVWNSSTGDELYSSWKESELFRNLEDFLRSTASGYGGTKRKRDENSSDSPQELTTIIQQLKANNYRVDQGNSQLVTSQHIRARPQRSDSLTANSSSTASLPADAKELIDLYFTHVHCWFPVLDRPSVLKAYYSLLKNATHQNRLNGGQALLWAIFAYAVQLDANAQGKSELSQKYSETALKHIPTPYTNEEDVHDFDVMQAQSLIILSLLRLGNGQWLGAWMCSGRAVRILLAKQNDHSKNKKGALQGCFIVETLLNVHFRNAKPLFLPSLIEHMMDEDGHEEWESWHTCEGPSFTFSIFNRLTRIFLVLHEAITYSSRATSEYVKDRLTTIHLLAQEHFSLASVEPHIDSPPHHIYFHIGLLFAQLRLSSLLPAAEAIHFELMPLATNVLGLFEICEKSAHVGLSRVPPIYADILNLAIDVAASARASFGASPGSPLYLDFVSTISDFRVRLSTIWASFRNTADSAETDLPVPDELASQSGPQQQLVPFPIEDTVTSQALFPASSIVADPINDVPAQVDYSHHDRHSFSTGTWSHQPAGLAFPTTSPSFTGDEVDALFHEMAQLDTSVWANDRTTGYKDFGFPNETAFLEFCNDPERLLPLESNMPLSSNSHSFFGSQVP